MTGCHLIERKFPSEDACNCCHQNNAWNDSSPNFSFTVAVYNFMIERKSLWISLSIFILSFWSICDMPLHRLAQPYANVAFAHFSQEWSGTVSWRDWKGSRFSLFFHAIKFPLKCVASKSSTAIASVARWLKEVLAVIMPNGVSFLIVISNKGT